MGDNKNASEFAAGIEAFQADYQRIVQAVAQVIVGHQQPIHDILTCLLSGGHALIEGVPGLGKTLLVRTLGQALDLSFSRIQFTPDLMPADITGTNIVMSDASGGKEFRFQSGPIFGNLILADEINRATPKTQSALLEAMQARTVSVARETHKLPKPFFVLATQNPLEMEGTYPLPEAQLDRFMFKIKLVSPNAEELVSIMDRTTGPEEPKAEKVADGRRIEQMREVVRRVPAPPHVSDYIARLVLASHPQGDGSLEITRKYVRYGASPRSAQAIILASKVQAVRDGRGNVALDDVKAAAAAAMRHRLILTFEGQADAVDPDEIIRQILDFVPEAYTV